MAENETTTETTEAAQPAAAVEAAAAEHPAEFPTFWHFERHLEDLGRELAGRIRRREELKAAKVPAADLEVVNGEIDAVRKQLTHYGADTRLQTGEEKRA